VSGEPSVDASGLRALGRAYARRRGAILEVRLEGTPERIGHDHARLLYDEMIADEGELYEQFERFVPTAPLRWLVMDLARLRFRSVDQGMTDERRREIAAQAAAFSPDPFDAVLPTYHRFVFLQSLYDIALSFERSPLVGCTSFALAGTAAEGGHVVLARSFDFEAGTTFDAGKAVFLVREEGRIPYASVAWPGLVGAVSGMNAEGLTLVVHGARAREPRAAGEPVPQAMRDVLARAHTTAEAIALLSERPAMVTHMVLLADAGGDVAIVERSPGAAPFVRRHAADPTAPLRVPLTNHLEGPLADDPANRRVEIQTSTRPRRLRLDELLAKLPEGATVQEIVTVLRDKRSVGGAPLPLGHRRAIDALIATHAVVMDATARTLWVSEGPHLVGRFVRFDAGALLAESYAPGADREVVTLEADPIRASGEHDAWVRAGSPHPGGP
jgi:hypothetical protein